MANLIEQRLRFQSQTDCKFVTPAEFLGVMTSRSSCVRADEPSANLLGLLDEQTGNRVLIPEEDFLKARDTISSVN